MPIALLRRRALMALAGLLSPAAALAATLTTVQTFTGPNGATPAYALVLVGGVLYGTTQNGGSANDGTLFKFDPATNTETVLYNFTGGADAALPQGPLVLYRGALYGVSYFGGGAANDGTVYKFDLATGTESVVHGFLGTDGAYPRGAVVIHGSNLYGTASYGGRYRNGSLFRVSLVTGAARVLHQFALAPDGASPEGGVTYDSGTIYGTTLTGGSTNAGTIFALNPHTGAYQRVYSFDGAHGGGSSAALTLHGGLLYGTGGCGPQGIGCIYSYDPSNFTETLLYAFSGADGSSPYAGVLYQSGALYGVTQQGGATDYGTVYKLDLATNTETVLYSFTGGADGNNPAAKLVYAAHNFYGSTVGGGSASMGTLFKFP